TATARKGNSKIASRWRNTIIANRAPLSTVQRRSLEAPRQCSCESAFPIPMSLPNTLRGGGIVSAPSQVGQPQSEHVPIRWNRDVLSIHLRGACPYRKTGSHFSGTCASDRGPDRD